MASRRRTQSLEAIRAARAAQYTDAERELVTAPCRLHSRNAVCDQCCGMARTDSLGFPHPAFAKGRTRCRLCPVCGKLKTIDEWNVDEVALRKGEAWRGGVCKSCTAAGDGLASLHRELAP